MGRYADAQVSQNLKAEIFRRQVLDEMDEDEVIDVGCDPAVDDFAVLSGHPIGRPRGQEIPWDFEAETEEEEDEDEALVKIFERGTPIIGRRM